MSVILQQSLSYIWGNEVLVNSMNRVHAIYKLIENPQIEDKDIQDILARTKEVWEGFKTLLYKVFFTVRVIISENFRVSFKNASDKLTQLIHKVSPIAIPEAPSEDEEEEIEVDEGTPYRNLLDEEAVSAAEKEILDLKQQIESFDKEHKSHYQLEYELNRCNEVAKLKAENIVLLKEYDDLSLIMFEVEKEMNKQKAELTKHLLKIKKTKSEEVSAILHELENRFVDLSSKVKNLKSRIDENSWKIGNDNPYKSMKPEALESKKKELEELIREKADGRPSPDKRKKAF